MRRPDDRMSESEKKGVESSLPITSPIAKEVCRGCMVHSLPSQERSRCLDNLRSW